MNMWSDDTLRNTLSDSVALPSLYLCDHLTVIRATGADAYPYLQGQLTCDLSALRSGAHRSAMHLSLKGRGLFSARLFALDDDIIMVLPTAMADVALAALSKYRLRAKVDFIKEERFAVFGVAGNIEDVNLLTEPPPAAGKCAIDSNAEQSSLRALLRYPFSDHGLMICSPDQAPGCWNELSVSRELGSSAAWLYQDIEAGEGSVFPGAEDQFLPQTLNYDVTGGVSFNKGCYTGQEVVARMHFKGKLKQRMQQVTYSEDVALAPGDTLRDADGRAVGQVVMAASGQPHRALVLLPAAMDSELFAETKPLNAALVPLPYNLPWK